MGKTVRFDWAIKYLLRNKANFDILEGFLKEEGEAIGLEKGKTIGLKEGELKTKYALAKKLFAQNFPLEQIAFLTELSLAELKQLLELAPDDL